MIRWFGRHHADMLGAWPETAYQRRSFPWQLPGRRLLVVNNGQAARQILVDRVQNYPKGALANFALRPLVGNGLILNEGEAWRERRRLLQPLFDQGRLPAFVSLVVQQGEAMLERWAEFPAGKVLELGPELSRVTAEVIARFHLGIPLGDLARQSYQALGEYQSALDLWLPLHLLGLPPTLINRLNRRGRRAVRQLDAVIEQMKREPTPGDDDLQTLLATAGIDGVDRRDELAFMFLAGHETTALTIGWALYELSRDPATAREVSAEIKRVLGTRRPGYEDLEPLVLARAVVSEALRLYPPIPILSRRASAADRIDGLDVPPGTELLVAPWLVQRHLGYWPEAGQFRPERFLAATLPKRRRDAYIPFGAGPRYCPGHRLGFTEATLLLVMILRRYHIEPRTTTQPRPQALLSLRPDNGWPVRLLDPW